MDKFTLKEMKGSGNQTMGQMQSKLENMNPKSKTGKASLQDELNHHEVLQENVASIEEQLAEAKAMADEKERHIQEKRMLEQQRSRGAKNGRLYDNPVFKEYTYWSTEKLGIVMDDNALVKIPGGFRDGRPGQHWVRARRSCCVRLRSADKRMAATPPCPALLRLRHTTEI